MDGLEPVPIETVDKALSSYFGLSHFDKFYMDASENERRAELNRLCATGWIKTIDNKTFKTTQGIVLAP